MVLIICINNDQYPLSLELNKEYYANETKNSYIIIDENYEDVEYPKEIFKANYYELN
jgi:hypothetical protein